MTPPPSTPRTFTLPDDQGDPVLVVEVVPQPRGRAGVTVRRADDGTVLAGFEGVWTWWRRPADLMAVQRSVRTAALDDVRVAEALPRLNASAEAWLPSRAPVVAPEPAYPPPAQHDDGQPPIRVALGDLPDLLRHHGRRVAAQGRVAGVQVGFTEEKRDTMTIALEAPNGGTALVYATIQGCAAEPSGLVEVEGWVRSIENPAARWAERDGQRRPGNTLVPAYLPFIDASSLRPLRLSASDALTEEQRAELKKRFGSITNEAFMDEVDGLIAPMIAGRALPKALALMTALSPIGVPLRSGERFALTTLLLGAQREGKDNILEDIASLCPLGTVTINAEVASRAGIVGGAVMDPVVGGWLVKWGALVEADLGLAYLSGVSGYPAPAISEMREILATRRATITKIARGTRDVRCRILMSANSAAHDDAVYPHGLAAFRDVQDTSGRALWAHPADVTRVHLVAVFRKAQVSLTLREDSLVGPRARSADDTRLLRLLIQDAWTPATPRPEAVVAILRQGLNALKAKCGSVILAVTDAERLKVALALTCAAARLRQRVTSDGARVLDLTKDDADLALMLLDDMVADLGVAEAAQEAEALEAQAREVAEALRRPEPWAGPATIPVGRFATILRALYGAYPTPMAADAEGSGLAAAMELSRRTLYDTRQAAERALEDRFPTLPPLVEVRPRVGWKLTTFGLRVCVFRPDPPKLIGQSGKLGNPGLPELPDCPNENGPPGEKIHTPPRPGPEPTLPELPESGTPARVILDAVTATPDISWEDAARIAGLDQGLAGAAIEDLLDRRLVHERILGRLNPGAPP